MAEGVEFEIPSLDTKYFCHNCSKEVLPFTSTELTCPDCSSGFLEEVSKSLFELDMSENYGEYFHDDENFVQDLIAHRRLLSQLFEDVDDSTSQDTDANESESQDGLELDPSFSSILQAPPLGPAFLTEPILQSSSISSNFIADHEAELLRMRFFDDFNADSEVDALASQLLDEVEISGPPPLTKDQIKALPVIVLQETHLAGSELQCTVCMNDFKVDEKAKQLTCEHLFHEKCITPWLERQASCPNCRRTIKVESKNKRSLSCPRTVNLQPRSSNSANRRFSEVSSLGEFFTAILD